jgi:hypothetical protein
LGGICSKGIGRKCFSWSANIGNDQVEIFKRPSAGPSCVLAVSQFENDNFMNVFPNPSDGQLNIRIKQFVGKVNIQVIDIVGVVYKSENEFLSE